MNKTLVILTTLILAGCQSLTQPNTNYARIGISHDRFDGMYYNYAEVGKNIPLTEHHNIILDVGYENGGGNDIINSDRQNWYGDAIYEFRF